MILHLGPPELGEAMETAAFPKLTTEAQLNAHEWRHVQERFRLAPQEARIAGLIIDGQRDKQIAAAMGLSIPTVRTYLTRIFQRIGVADRTELVVRIFACARELRPPDGGALK